MCAWRQCPWENSPAKKNCHFCNMPEINIHQTNNCLQLFLPSSSISSSWTTLLLQTGAKCVQLYTRIIPRDLAGYVSWFFSCYLPSGSRDVWLCPDSSNSNNNVSLASSPSGLADMKSAQTKSDLCMPRAISPRVTEVPTVIVGIVRNVLF